MTRLATSGQSHCRAPIELYALVLTSNVINADIQLTDASSSPNVCSIFASKFMVLQKN